MKNKQIIGLVVAGAVFIVTGVTSVLTNTFIMQNTSGRRCDNDAGWGTGI